MTFITTLLFGDLLKQLRKRAGMTQGDLAAALGYSIALISALERNQRLPDLDAVIQRYLPALTLQEEPHLAVQLVESAAHARGERLPATWTVQRERRLVISDEVLIESPRLPLLPTALIGREQEIEQISKRLLGHRGRLLTLVGPPGIGKTHLALAVAAQLQPYYRDGVVFVPLAAVNEATTLASTILAAVGSSDSSPKPPKARLIEFLRRQSLLLVLDNFEQLLAPAVAGQAVGLVADLLAECPGVAVLATSRERLHLRAEQRYPVPTLPIAAAVALFTQRAAAVDATFAHTDANHPTLEAICQRLDCLPLAIELCAARIDLLSPTQLLSQLQARRLDLLVDGAHDLPPRQRTLRAAIEHSYQLLTEEQRTLFRSLGVFVGGFALPEVAAVSGWNQESSASSLLATLHALIGKSLVHVETTPTDEQRFLLLETIREFALEQARLHGDEELLRQRLYAAYLQLFRTGDSHLRGAEAATWLTRLKAEQNNLRAALQWALDERCYEDAAWLLIAVGYFWMLNGQRYESARWIARLLPYRQTLAVDLRLVILIDFVVSAGESGEFPSLDLYRAEIISLMDVCPNKQIQSVGWHFLAQSHEERTRAYTLAQAASEAPELGPEFGAHADHDFVLAANQVGYAGALLYQGEVVQATILVNDSLHRFRRRGNHPFIAESLGILGHYTLFRGDISAAYVYLQESMTIGTNHNLRIVHAEWQWLMGLITLYAGNAQEARRLLEECLPLCLDVKNTFHLALVCTCLAETALWEGDLAQAAAWLGQSLAYQADARSITVYEVGRLWVAARLATAQGHYPRAATLFGLAEQMHSQIRFVIVGPMRFLADAALATVREALEPAVFAEAFAAGGQQMTLDEAFAGILAPKDIHSPHTHPF